MVSKKTSKLVRSACACTATLSLTLGLLGPAATRAMAETAGTDGIQVVGEATAQSGADQEGVVEPTGTADAQADTSNPDTGDQDVRPQDDGLDPVEMRKTADESKGQSAKKDESEKEADTEKNAGAVTYIDENGNEQTIADYTDISDAKFEDKCGYGLADGWYVVTRDRSFEHRLTITGDAKLILCDGAKATFESGIRGYSGKLTVYGQKGQSGTLYARASRGSENAAIGGNKGEGNNTELCFCGGNVVGNAHYSNGSAGIGGGTNGGAGSITINGGTVKATSDVTSWGTGGGPGIGAGNEGDGGEVTINGGTVVAEGEKHGSGIGTGRGAQNGIKITINGGDVTATGGRYGAGIGGGDESGSQPITITGGTIHANGGTDGPGIGNGEKAPSCPEITISGGDVTAVGGSYGAGIGGGNRVNGGSTTITGGTVKAKSLYYGAGIGGGGRGGSGGTVLISGGTVTAESGLKGAGIGGGVDGKGGDVTITGGTVEATAGEKAAAFGHGGGCDDNGTASIPDDYMVSGSFDKGGEVVRARTPERYGYLNYRRYAKVEACDHKHSSYKPAEGGHSFCCENCAKGAGSVLAHEYDEHGTCAKCGFERPAPKFAETTIDAAGEIGPTFWIHFPKGAGVKIDKVELSVGGKRARTECHTLDDGQCDGRGFYGFTMGVTAIEMSEPVKAVVTYDDGQKVESTTTVEELIKRQVKGDEDDVSTKPAKARLLKSLANLGHYEQPWLSAKNHWVIGKDYTRTELHFKELNKVDEAAEALKPYVGGVTEGAEHIAKVASSVRMGASATLELYLTPKKGDSFGACTASVAGHKATCEVLADGRLHVSAPGITAVDYDKDVVVTGTCGGAALKAHCSVLAYCNKTMAASSKDQQAREALSSVYWYYNFAKDMVN